MSPNVWVAFWLGVFIGCIGGVILAAIMAANARQAACEDAFEKGRAEGRRAVWAAMAGDLRRHRAYSMEDDIAAAFPARPKDAA